jgi:serine/threonine protein phosphatase PrpC
MTRSIGDLVAGSVGVTSEPEIQVFNCLTTFDRAIIIASDGLWDRLSNSEITRIAMAPQYLNKNDADGAINVLMNEAVLRW